MRKLGIIVGLGLAAIVAGAVMLVSFMGQAKVEAETPFLIPAGSSLTSVAQNLETAGHITSADGFLLFQVSSCRNEGPPMPSGQ